MDEKQVKKVIVVFKTHLDIGFTASAAEVLKNYHARFIPAAIDLAERVNADGKKRFVWTVGSYLIKHYFDHANEAECARLARAIERGDVAWHGLAYTTHTELMDGALMRYGLSISQALDARFHRETIAAKMTDVPGHTVALVPYLAKTGIEYLHIGVNNSSRMPEVPKFFRWKYGEDEIVVHYEDGYGKETVLPNGVALAFCHAQDNAGPPAPEFLEEAYRELVQRYPNADIGAGTLDDFAREVRSVRDSFPVVTQEIGDTWIHGVATDPLKVSQYLRLLKLGEAWVKYGALDPNSPAYGDIMEQLLLVAEHTWGMDTKKYLFDFANWTKADFQAARKRDKTDYTFFSPRNAHILAALKDELRAYRGENEVSSYSVFEASHAEQRAYIDKALEALPEELAQQAKEEFAFAMPEIPQGALRHANEPFDIGAWRVTVGANGALCHIANAALNVDMKANLGLFAYETFDGKTAMDCFFDYGRDLKQNFHWAECDFSKPGLRYETSIRRNAGFALPARIVQSGSTLYIRLRPAQELCEAYGCPRQLLVTHEFGDTIKTTLYWAGKDAIRSPEAIWFGMTLEVSDPRRWRVVKLGLPVSPFEVVTGGNRKLHCAKKLVYDVADCRAMIEAFDAPLLSVGGRHLYDVDDAYGDMTDGLWYLLYNNRWGTNFKQWFEEDMRFAFETKIEGVL